MFALEMEIGPEGRSSVGWSGSIVVLIYGARGVEPGEGDDSEDDSKDKREVRQISGGGGCLSGLLNALDGISAAQEGRVHFATTN